MGANFIWRVPCRECSADAADLSIAISSTASALGVELWRDGDIVEKPGLFGRIEHESRRRRVAAQVLLQDGECLFRRGAGRPFNGMHTAIRCLKIKDRHYPHSTIETMPVDVDVLLKAAICPGATVRYSSSTLP